MNARRGSLVVKCISIILSSAILLLAPGPDSWRALATTFEAGKISGPISISPALPTMDAIMAPENFRIWNRLAFSGINGGEIIAALSDPGQITPEMRQIIDAALSPEEALQNLAAQAARARAEADGLTAIERQAAASGDLSALEEALKRIDPYRALLDSGRRRIAVSVGERANQYKTESLKSGVKRAVQNWQARIDQNPVAAQPVVPEAAFSHKNGPSHALQPAVNHSGDAKASEPPVENLGPSSIKGEGETISLAGESRVKGLPLLVRSAKGFIQKHGKVAVAAISVVGAAAAIIVSPATLVPFAAMVDLTAKYATAMFTLVAFSPAMPAVALISGITIHELAHLWMARRLGDDTAKRFGRESMNPLKHLDPIGSIAVPALSLLAGSAFLHVPLILGWAKAIPVDYNKLADPKRDAAKVAAAGPAVNAALAALAWIGRMGLISLGVISAAGPAAAALHTVAVVNLALTLFNLFAPLPHADGFKIGVRYWPQKLYKRFWARDPNIKGEAAQHIFSRLYDGPAGPLALAKRWIKAVAGRLTAMDNDRAGLWINRGVWGASVALFAGVSWMAYAHLGMPFTALVLACSQAYYCIYEHEQNKEAVKALQGIFNGLSLLASDFSRKGLLHSEVDVERFENILAEVLDGGLMDQIIDSDGFDALTNDQKWARFKEPFIAKVIEALKKDPRGLASAKDTPELIRRVLFDSPEGNAYLQQLRQWMEKEWDGRDIWSRWRTKGRMKKGQEDQAEESKKQSGSGSAGKILGLAALVAVGAFFGAHHAAWAAGMGLIGFLGSIEDVSQQAPKPESAPSVAANKREPYKPFVKMIKEAIAGATAKGDQNEEGSQNGQNGATGQNEDKAPAQAASLTSFYNKDVTVTPEQKEQETGEIGFLADMLQKGVIKEMEDDDRPVVGRLKQTDKLVRLIGSRRGDISGMLLVGKAGVGKTAIVRKIIHSIVASRKETDDSTFRQETMENRYYLELNPVALNLEDKPLNAFKMLLDILPKFNSKDEREGAKIVLLIDEFHALFKGRDGNLLRDLLKKPLEKGQIIIIGGTTEEEYKRYIREDEALKRRLPRVDVEAYTPAEALRALRESREFYEKRYGVKFTEDAIKAMVEDSAVDQEHELPGRAFYPAEDAARDVNYASRRARMKERIKDKISELKYFLGLLEEEKRKLLAEKDRVRPADAPSVIDQENTVGDLVKDLVAVYRRLRGIPAGGVPIIDRPEIDDVIMEATGVTQSQLASGKEDNSKYLHMEDALNKVVVGQEEASRVISEAVRRAKAGMNDSENEPMGVFLITGPTGTGKTYFAKKLAEFLFGDEDAMIRFDMSEYMQSHETSKLIGSPNGYVGYEEGGQLTEAVRKRPNSVLLFDEIEKANPAAWLIFLQIFSDGRLTDNHGRTVSFKNTLILMTSNLGMMALDLKPYADEYKKLKAQWQAAEGNAEARAAADQKIKEFGDRMAREVRAKAVSVTQEAMRKTFPPEFRGRLQNEPIVFNPITPEMAEKIVPLELEKLRQKIQRRGNDIEWPLAPEVVKFLMHEGFSVEEGARPLRNVIKNLVEAPISKEILRAVDAAPAGADGRKIAPKLLIKLKVEGGRLQVSAVPLPPRKAERTPPEEAAVLEVFRRAIDAVDQAVSEDAALEWTEHILDAWVLEVLNKFGLSQPAAETSPKTDAPKASADKTESAPVQSPENRPGTGGGAASVMPPSEPFAFLAENKPLEMSKTASSLPDAATWDQDSGIELRRQLHEGAISAISAALKEHGYPQAVQDALLNIPGSQNPVNGYLGVVLRHAHERAAAADGLPPLRVRWQVTGQDARIVIHRTGGMPAGEEEFIKNHLTGPVPASLEDSRARAQALNNMERRSASWQWFELYRLLSEIPGAQAGYSSSSTGTDYWIKIPHPPVSASRPGGAGGEIATAQSPPSVIRSLLTSNSFPQTVHLEFLEPSQIPDSPQNFRSYFRTPSPLSSARHSLTHSLTEEIPSDVHRFLREEFGVPRQTQNGPSSSETTAAPSAESQETQAIISPLNPAEAQALLNHIKVFSDEAPMRELEREFGDSARDRTVMVPDFLNPRSYVLADWLQQFLISSRGRPYRLEGGWYTGWTTKALDTAADFALDVARRVEADPSLQSTIIQVSMPVMRLIQARLASPASSSAVSSNAGGNLPPATQESGQAQILNAPSAQASGQATAEPQKPSVSPKITTFDPATIPAASKGRVYIRVTGEDFKRAVVEALRAAGIAALPMFPRSAGEYQAFASLEDAAKAAAAAAALAALGTIQALAVHPEAMELLRGGAVKAIPAPLLPDASPAAESESGAAAASEGPMFEADGGLRRYILRLFEQSDKMSFNARYAAAELFGVIARPQDAAWAREIFSDPNKTSDIPKYYAEIAAAALILGRYGNSDADRASIQAIIESIKYNRSHNLYPLQALMAKAWAGAIKPADQAQLDKIKDEYEHEGRTLYNPVLQRALYLALARYGNRDPKVETRLVDEYLAHTEDNPERFRELYGYLKRNDPEYLKSLYRKLSELILPQGAEARLDLYGSGLSRAQDMALAWYAAADFSSPEDAPNLMSKIIRLLEHHAENQNSHSGIYLTDIAGMSVARLAKHFHAYDSIKSGIELWLKRGFEYGNEDHLQMALQVLSQLSTDQKDEDLMETFMRTQPDTSAMTTFVTGFHEVNQQESAVAWAKIAVRSGRIKKYFLPTETDEDGKPASRIDKMLTDTNPFINKAAMEALKLYFQVRRATEQLSESVRRR